MQYSTASGRFIAYLPIQLQNWSPTALQISVTITPAQKRADRQTQPQNAPAKIALFRKSRIHS